MAGAVGPASHRGPQEQGSQRRLGSSWSHSRPHLPSAPLSDNTIHRLTDVIRDHAPHGGYQPTDVLDAGNNQFGIPQGGATGNNLLGSATHLGAVGNAPSVLPPPTQPRDQSFGSQMYGVGSDSQGYYPEEINRLNRSQPSWGIPSASQTPATSYFSDAGSEGYRTGSSMSRRSRHSNPVGNTPAGGQPLGLGFGPNILNPIDPNRGPQGNMVPQGNVPYGQPPGQPNVVPHA